MAVILDVRFRPKDVGHLLLRTRRDRFVQLEFGIDGDQFCYTLDVAGLTAAAAAAHVHSAPRGEAGPIRIPLSVPNETSFHVEDCTLVSDPAILAGVQENPGGWYVNVHTSAYPGGEVRGQLK